MFGKRSCFIYCKVILGMRRPPNVNCWLFDKFMNDFIKSPLENCGGSLTVNTNLITVVYQDDEIVEVHISDSFMDDDVEHNAVTERDGLKKRCLDQLKAMINLVEEIGDDENLEKLAYQLGDIHANTHSKAPEQVRSYSRDGFVNFLESYVDMETLPTNTKPIEVIVESEPEVNHSIPTSVVEIALHDHAVLDDEWC